MRMQIKEILSKHKIIDPNLLSDLNELYTRCLQTGKRYGIQKGMRSVEVSKTEEALFWEDVKHGYRRYQEDPEDIFNNTMLDKLKTDYGIHKKHGRNLQSP